MTLCIQKLINQKQKTTANIFLKFLGNVYNTWQCIILYTPTTAIIYIA